MNNKEKAILLLKDKTCEMCGEPKPDVEYVADPYDADVYGTITLRYLCNRCCGDIADDV